MDHSKTTLTAALTKGAGVSESEVKAYDQIDAAPEGAAYVRRGA